MILIYLKLPVIMKVFSKRRSTHAGILHCCHHCFCLYFFENFSLIPVLGLLSCFYLMAQESHTNWYRFVIWLVIGLVIYFSYGRWNSKLAKKEAM